MRVYFTACEPAALKLNGEYAGRVDLFERYADIKLQDRMLAEIVPANLQPVNFFLDEKLLSDPPEFLNVYLGEGEAVLYVNRFESRSAKLEIVFQTRFENNLVTLFSQGGSFLAVEGAEYSLYELGRGYSAARAEEKLLNGRRVLAIFGDGRLTVISENGKKIFSNRAESAVFGEKLTVKVRFNTCTAAEAECEYAYENGQLTLEKSRTAETFEPDVSVMHFAFFESVLVCADCRKYLSPELAGRADELRGYLGAFTGVMIPTEKFRAEHPRMPAAGLIYPKTENLAEIRYFAVEFAGGKIDNIYPV